MDTPYEPAPELPPGPSLLDDNESNMLDNFFTTMNANHFTNDFWQRGQQNKSSGPVNFEWSEDLPPTFEGSTTSLSQPSFQQLPLGKSNGGLVAGHAAGPDIFTAASMLYQQGGINGAELGSALTQQAFQTPHLSANGAGMSPKDTRRDSKASNPTTKAANATPTRAQIPTGYHTSEMFFDVHDPIPADQHPSRKSGALQWGSDVSFMGQGYVRPAGQPDDEQRTKDLLEHLECFSRQSSTTNTRAPSPDPGAGAHGQQTALRANRVDDATHPRKRQRTLVKDEDEAVSDEDEPRPQSGKSKNPGNARGRRTSTDTSRKRRLSSTAKPVRENLTEEQKRTNHILSEQKRRNLIRQGFDDLCSLVPGLRGGGFSKSAMLTQAADWLEDLLHGNELLQSQLADLKGINGLVMPR